MVLIKELQRFVSFRELQFFGGLLEKLMKIADKSNCKQFLSHWFKVLYNANGTAETTAVGFSLTKSAGVFYAFMLVPLKIILTFHNFQEKHFSDQVVRKTVI